MKQGRIVKYSCYVCVWLFYVEVSETACKEWVIFIILVNLNKNHSWFFRIFLFSQPSLFLSQSTFYFSHLAFVVPFLCVNCAFIFLCNRNIASFHIDLVAFYFLFFYIYLFESPFTLLILYNIHWDFRFQT